MADGKGNKGYYSRAAIRNSFLEKTGVTLSFSEIKGKVASLSREASVTVRGPFTKEEDDKLMEAIEKAEAAAGIHGISTKSKKFFTPIEKEHFPGRGYHALEKRYLGLKSAKAKAELGPIRKGEIPTIQRVYRARGGVSGWLTEAAKELGRPYPHVSAWARSNKRMLSLQSSDEAGASEKEEG